MKNANGALASTRTILVLISGLVIWNCLGNSVTAADKSGSELIVNGDMEDDDPPDSWKARDATLSADADCHSGKQSLKISALVNGGQAMQPFPVNPDTKYRLEFWYKCSAAGGLYVYVHVSGAEGNQIGDSKNDDAWTRWTGEFDTSKISPPPDRATVGFTGWPGGDVLIDDVSITEVKPNEKTAPVAREAPADVSQAAKQNLADAAKALRSWQLLFPGRKYLCWDKNPWDKLAKAQPPPTAERPGYEFPFQECREINLAMGENEYESASFVLSNLSDKPAEFAISAKGAGIPITIRQAVWVTAYNGKEINDALPLLEGNLSIPSGESREVWLTLYTNGIKHGDYNPQIMIKPQGDLPASSVNLKVKIYPVSLPDTKPIYTQYWDYLVPEWTTPEVAQALVEDMKAHYVNVPTIHPWPARLCDPGKTPKLDSDGNLKRDYTELDKLLGYYQQLNPKMIVFSWNPDAYLMNLPGFPFFGAEWKKLFSSYITGLVSHLKEKGFGYEKFALHPYDEVLDERVYNMAKLIKEIDPKIKIIVNATASPDEMKNIAPYVDIFMPHLYGFVDRTDEAKNLAEEILPKGRKFYWTYANPVPPFPQAVSPYGIYRLSVWRAWSEGMGGYGNWIYSYKTHWNSYKHEDGENWAMVYFANAKDAPPGISKKELVVTSKRWEATREGVEDYVYLYLLKDAIRKAGGEVSPESLNKAKQVLADSPKKVLGDLKNTRLADEAKEEILRAIVKLYPAKNR